MDTETENATSEQVPAYAAGIVIGAILALIALELIFRGSSE